MSNLSLSMLKSLTPPFASEADRAAAEHYWQTHPAEERAEANKELLRQFYLTRGLDIDKPVERTIRRITLEEKNRDHDEWHAAFNQFHASR